MFNVVDRGLLVLVVMGLVGLIGGWYPAGRGRYVRGLQARFLGLLALLPFPVAITVGYCLGLACRLMQIPVPREAFTPIGNIIALVVMTFFIVLITILGYRWSDPDRAAARMQAGGFDDDSPNTAKPPAQGENEWWSAEPAESSGMARASLMLGISSLFVTLLASIPAFILGGLALAKINRSGGRIGGKGAAVAGIVTGIIGTFTGFIVLALLIPYLRNAGDPGAVGAEPPAVVMPAPVPGPVVARKGGAPRLNVADARPNAVAPNAPARPKAAPTRGGFARSSSPVPAVAIDTKPEASKTFLAMKPRTVVDLKVTDVKVDAKQVPRCLVWGDGGTVVFILETDGTLRRVVVDGFREELKWEIGHKCSWLSTSSEGLVLTVDSLQEVWSLDPKTFAIKTRTPAASVTHADSSPAIPLAFATNNGGGAMAVIDLKAGKVLREYNARSFDGQIAGFGKLVVAPDGKSIFAEGSEKLIRYAVDGDELTPEEQSDRIAQNGRAIEVSPDGAYVALPSGGGNYGQPPYTTYVYRTSDLSKPEIRVTSGAYPQALGFDLKAGFLYAQNYEDSLILFQPSGTKAKSYRLAGPRGGGGSTRQFLVHPDGGKLLALGDNALWYVELPTPGSPAPAAGDDTAAATDDDAPKATRRPPVRTPSKSTGKSTAKPRRN